MPKKIKDVMNASGVALSVANATPMADGKSYIRNPKNPNQVLQIQTKEGNFYKCFAVTTASPIAVDSSNAIYVSENSELQLERI